MAKPMMDNQTEIEVSAPQATRRDEATQVANAVLLSPRECLAAAGIVIAVLVALPILWQAVEPLDTPPAYRMPYALSEDYWLFDRYSRQAAAGSKTLVLGDSAIWGQYVTPDQTLPQQLSALAGEPRYANLGVNGMHPVALAGLLEYFGSGIRDGRVILHCNLLWTASAEHDLQADQVDRFNHPGLVPQFVPRIPCYRAKCSERLGVLAERIAPFGSWARHLRPAYFGNDDLPAWTIEHPYANPADVVLAGLPAPSDKVRYKPISWLDARIPRADFDWVDLSSSRQWQFFRQAVNVLRRRGNRVFVLVGPFNEHMLTDASRRTYVRRRSEVEAWLREQGIAHWAPDPLPGELYADASHPLAAGYARLAAQLRRQPAFVAFDERK